jgi:hypothetical protein
VPLAFWEAFFLGVAVTVVSGVILGVIFGGWRRVMHRRAEMERAAAERYTARSPLRAGLSAVASELRDCTDIAERCETGQGHIPELVARLPTQAWADRRGEMMPLRDEDRETWDDLEETYRLLRQSKQSGGFPPKSADLLALSERLEEKLEAESS